jgi:hypothetical protein
MSMIILSPKGVAEERVVPMMEPLDSLEGKVIGIVDNGHHNGTPVLEAVRDLLLSRYGVSRVVLRKKPWISQPAPDALYQEMRGSCDAVLAGIGD